MSKKSVITEAPVRVLKNGTCPNLSGKSTLSYRIGVDDAGQIMLNEAANSDDLYSFKVVLQDGYTIYCQGLVMGDPINIGTIDNVVTKSSTINMQSAGRGFVYVAAP